MLNKRLMMISVCVLACAVAMTGCKKKPTKGPGLDAGNIGGVTGTDIGTEGMGADARAGAEMGTELTGQFSPVYFDYDSAQINPAERSKLEAVAEHLKKGSTQTLIVEGHCDERGSNEYNLTLGERRALAVRAFLVGLGVDGSRVTTKSLGEERPAAVGHDEASWSKNRRGEFVLVQ
jgi:peptidoglycan-associated lipoprotein